MTRYAFLFPGQGAQIVGMGKEFYENFSEAKEIFQFGDEILERSLSKIIFNGPEGELTETRNSQPAIYLTSLAILAVLKKQLPDLKPNIVAGLSLGEYTALTAGEKISFENGLPLVDLRAFVMNEACEKTKGTMAALFGLSSEEIEEMILNLNLSHELWIANYNAPGQTVISGTLKAVEKGIEEAKKRGAKRAIPLKVHGAFHSGLMKMAEEKLAQKIMQTELLGSSIEIVMNVPGALVENQDQIRNYLIQQLTSSVRWEQSIRAMMGKVEQFIEIGCGRILAGLNKQMGVPSTVSINKIEDLDGLATMVS